MIIVLAPDWELIPALMPNWISRTNHNKCEFVVGNPHVFGTWLGGSR